MNKQPMNEEAFAELWQHAEAEGYAQRLASEYPKWRVRRQRTLGITAMLVVAVAVALPLMLPHTSEKQYSQVYCNRPHIDEQQWVDLATDLLIS